MPKAWIDAQGGASGDMLLAALIHAGCPVRELNERLNAALDLGHAFRIHYRKMTQAGFEGGRVDVQLKKGSRWVGVESVEDHHHRHLSDILKILGKAKLPKSVVESASRVFTRLAQAEAAVHGIGVEQVHFHEVGALDAIIDITGVCLGLHLLGCQEIHRGPIGVGSGTVRSAHGVLPLPAPATSRLLTGQPILKTAEARELCTPTGAALLVELASFRPDALPMRVLKTGIGLSHRVPEQAPPFLRFNLFESCSAGVSGDQGFEKESLSWLCCNLDDMTPEYLALAMEMLMEAGALDVSVSPLQMKKNRSGQELRVLSRDKDREHMLSMMFRHTTTLGVRCEKVERFSLPREMEKVRTPWGMVRVKCSAVDGVPVRHPEYEDVAAICRKNKVTYKEVLLALSPKP